MSSYAVEFQHVTKKINHQKILDNVSFKIPKYSITLIEGINGSGKTTTIKLLCKLVKPNKGHIISTNAISYSPEHFPNNLNITIKDYFKYIKQLNDIAFQQQIFDLFISQLYLQPFLTAKLKDCSLGTRQKVNLIQCLVIKKELYVLDEPFNALDHNSTQFIKSYLLQLKKKYTVILTCHNQDIQNLISHKLLIENGNLIDCSLINRSPNQMLYKRVIIDSNNRTYLNKVLRDKCHHFEVKDNELHVIIRSADLNSLLQNLINNDLTIKEVGDYIYD